MVDTQACFVVVPHGLYFYRPSDSEVVLKFLDFVHGAERTVATMPTTQLAQVGRMTISPDEKWVAYGHEDGTATDLVLVKNFR